MVTFPLHVSYLLVCCMQDVLRQFDRKGHLSKLGPSLRQRGNSLPSTVKCQGFSDVGQLIDGVALKAVSQARDPQRMYREFRC